MGRYVFKLPDVGEGIAEAELVEWRVAVGDVIEEDAPLADVMTDKANVELGSPVSGRVIERYGEAGQMVPIGSVLVVFEVEGEDSAQPSPVTQAPARAETPSAPAQSSRGEQASAQRSGPAPAAPAVRKRARQLGLDLEHITGSGPQGRVLHEDLDAHLRQSTGATPADGGEAIKVTGLRRRIAERMSEAALIPQLGYVEEIDVTALEDLRARLNADTAVDRPRLTLLPFLISAMVRVLPRFPQINAHYLAQEDLIRRHTSVHVGVATQTDRGLMAPVLRDAQALDLWQAAAEIARLAAATRAGKATLEELSGSTITITSLGRLGGIATAPIINPPEVAILGPNRVADRAVVVNGQIVVRRMMNLSSSFDHRVVDGYDAAQFIQAIKAELEQPLALVEARPGGLATS